MRKIWCFAIVMLFGLSLFASCNDNTKSSSDKQADQTGAPMTLQQYNQIEYGMSYQQVREIIGKDGVLTAELGEKDTESHTLTYTWQGNDEASSMAELTFINDKLVTRTQVGLQ